MGMEEARRDTSIAIERAHRIGRFSKDRAGPIVVNFANYKHKNNVLKNKSKLQGSDYVSKNNSVTKWHKKENLFNL